MESLEFSFDIQKITPETLHQALLEVASKMLFARSQYDEAYKKFCVARANRKRCEQFLYKSKRLELVNKGLKPTEKMIDAEVQTDDQCVDLQEQETIADIEKSKWLGLYDSAKEIKEILMTLEVSSRRERENTVY